MFAAAQSDSHPSIGRYRFSYTPFNLRLFTLLGVGPVRSGVEVNRDHVRVKMGWSASICLARSSIQSAEHSKKPFGFGAGVHGLPGRWVFNGSNDGIVKLTLDPPGRGRTLVFPIKPRELYLSLEDPSGFIEELGFPG